MNLHVLSQVVIAGYQLSMYLPATEWLTARLHNEQLLSTITTQGKFYYYSLNSLWMDYQRNAEYEFGVTYRTAYSTSFEDC